MKINWSGNMTLKMGGKEESYLLDSIEVKQDTKNTLTLKITGKGEEAKVVIPLSQQECKRLVGELIQSI
jgi:hypothetical protein